MAVEKGYITQDQLSAAMAIRLQEALNGFEPRLIVQILLDMGYCNASQIMHVLDAMAFPIEFCQNHMKTMTGFPLNR